MTSLEDFGDEVTAARKSLEARARKVISKASSDITRDAQRAAPVDTGNLRSSISREVRGLQAEIGPTASYGIWVELGTSRMAPQPYLFPALDKNLPAMEAAMTAITEGLL